MFRLYRNPDLDDRIYECLLTAMADVQAVDALASFLFMGDLNGHNQGPDYQKYLQPCISLFAL